MDGLRAVALGSVNLSHLAGRIYNIPGFYGSFPIWLSRVGFFGVRRFFVISGC